MPTLLTAEKRKTLEAAPQNRPTRARRIIAFTADRFLVSACVWRIGLAAFTYALLHLSFIQVMKVGSRKAVIRHDVHETF